MTAPNHRPECRGRASSLRKTEESPAGRALGPVRGAGRLTQRSLPSMALRKCGCAGQGGKGLPPGGCHASVIYNPWHCLPSAGDSASSGAGCKLAGQTHPYKVALTNQTGFPIGGRRASDRLDWTGAGHTGAAHYGHAGVLQNPPRPWFFGIFHDLNISTSTSLLLTKH